MRTSRKSKTTRRSKRDEIGLQVEPFFWTENQSRPHGRGEALDDDHLEVEYGLGADDRQFARTLDERRIAKDYVSFAKLRENSVADPIDAGARYSRIRRANSPDS